MTIPSVGVADDADRQKIIDLITLGFSADPMLRWVWPDAQAYLENAPKFVAAFGGHAFEHGTAYSVGHCAAALWLPPKVEPDAQAMGAVVEASASPEVLGDLLHIVEQMETCHPDRPYWYLPLIAADPAHQGRGLGSALMKHALRRCDEEGLPACLESSNPRNISLYERHGFEVIRTVQAGNSPVIHPMLRVPRK